MITEIHSNGSHFAGAQVDAIDTLLIVLTNHPLDRTFENYGNFFYPNDNGGTQFFGNFFTVSHVFNIDTDDPAFIAALQAAIRSNQQRPDYLSQDTEDMRCRKVR